jgi:hypothetical protein
MNALKGAGEEAEVTREVGVQAARLTGINIGYRDIKEMEHPRLPITRATESCHTFVTAPARMAKAKYLPVTLFMTSRGCRREAETK